MKKTVVLHENRLTPEEKRRIQELRHQGVQTKQIARRFGVTPGQITKIVMERKW